MSFVVEARRPFVVCSCCGISLGREMQQPDSDDVWYCSTCQVDEEQQAYRYCEACYEIFSEALALAALALFDGAIEFLESSNSKKERKPPMFYAVESGRDGSRAKLKRFYTRAERAGGSWVTSTTAPPYPRPRRAGSSSEPAGLVVAQTLGSPPTAPSSSWTL